MYCELLPDDDKNLLEMTLMGKHTLITHHCTVIQPVPLVPPGFANHVNQALKSVMMLKSHVCFWICFSVKRMLSQLCLVSLFHPQSEGLKKSAQKLETSYRCKNIKLIVVIVAVALVIILIIILLATGVIPVNAPLTSTVNPTFKP